jgi:uncharacterized protein YjbJ (UPF0337 family)
MNNEKEMFAKKWPEIQAKMKQQWPEMSDDEVIQLQGNYDMLHDLLQKKYGYDKDKAKHEVNGFMKRYGWHKES